MINWLVIDNIARSQHIARMTGLRKGGDPEAPLAFTIENCSITRIDRIDGPGTRHGWRIVTVHRPPG
jgi:alpha-ribazole phosphatase